MRIEQRLKKIGAHVVPARWLYHKYRNWTIANISRNMPRFFDAIETTELAGRWWLWGGALLGFVREGRPLRWDHDVDFAIERKDVELLLRSLPRLKRLGIRPKRNFLDNDGQLLGLHLKYRGIIYDFFVLDDDGPQTYLYSQFGVIDGSQVRQVAHLPHQRLDTIEALGRAWPCAADLDLELTAMYGNWREPDPSWSYLTAPNIRSTEPWSRDLDSWEDIPHSTQHQQSTIN